MQICQLPDTNKLPRIQDRNPNHQKSESGWGVGRAGGRGRGGRCVGNSNRRSKDNKILRLKKELSKVISSSLTITRTTVVFLPVQF